MDDSVLLDEVAALIIESLQLEGVSAADIDPSAPLFGGGLGLDSIDALELALAVSQRYGVQLSSDDPNIRTAFGSLRSLRDYIQAHSA
jgi:acyl carrier protein